jgi:hypothetical protein
MTSLAAMVLETDTVTVADPSHTTLPPGIDEEDELRAPLLGALPEPQPIHLALPISLPTAFPLPAFSAVKPRFTTFTLPPKYDGLRPLTKLWLQSRVIAIESDSDDDSASGSDGQAGEIDDDDFVDDSYRYSYAYHRFRRMSQGRSSLINVETDDNLTLRLAGWARPITLTTVGIHIDLWRALWPRCLSTINSNRHLIPHVLMHVTNVVLTGIMPAAT